MKYSNRLLGVTVLVTRPEHQAAPLCRLLESAGATTLRFPALTIQPIDDRQELLARLGPAAAFDLVIFSSANAVKFGASLLDPDPDQELAAIGPATARALHQAGRRVAIAPAESFDSEHLLLHASLQHPAGRRILLIKGRGGRELLREQLSARGAHVAVAEVYVRARAEHSIEQRDALAATFATGGINVVTATSVDVAKALLELATPSMLRELNRVHWLVPGERVAAALRQRGISAPVLKADSAEDQDLVAAIERWRSSVSGA